VAEAVDIEAVVREVLRRLGALSSAAESPAPQSSVPSNSSAPPTNGSFALSDKLVTLAALDGRLSNTNQLVVSRSAIITPAVKDELKRRGIALIRRDADSQTLAEVRLLATVANCSFSTSARKSLTQAAHGIEWIECHATNSLVGAIQELTRQVKHRSLPGFVLTSQPIAAALIANRDANIRASSAADLRSLDEAIAQVGANLIAVDPTRISSAVLSRIAQRLASSTPTCPAELKAK
jgi:hypothetical protein